MSKLRCWPGCLAEVVKSSAGNEGKIVKVLRFVGELHGWVGSDRWEIESLSGPMLAVYEFNGMPVPEFGTTARDSRLRPITPPPGAVTDSEVKELFAPNTTQKERQEA